MSAIPILSVLLRAGAVAGPIQMVLTDVRMPQLGAVGLPAR